MGALTARALFRLVALDGSLEILEACAQAWRTWKELCEYSGLARKTATARIRALVSAGLLSRSPGMYARGRTRPMYAITRRGADVLKFVERVGKQIEEARVRAR